MGKSISKTFVWVLLGLLFVGLAGFGATNLSGTIRTVGFAGNQTIGVDQFAREFQQELRAVQALRSSRSFLARGPTPISLY